MDFVRKHLKIIVVATSCVAIGAGAGAIASAGAAGGTSTTTTANSGGATAAGASGARRAGRAGALRRAVHGDLTVATRRGFATVTFDRGLVQSVQGQQLTLREGNRTTSKTVTLTIPSNARVRDNGQQATLADVKPGQRALVVQGLRVPYVIARTPRSS